MQVKVEKVTVVETEDCIKLDPPLDLYTVELKTDPREGTVGGVWCETFGSELELVRFMRGVEAGRAMSGYMEPLRWEVPR